MQSTILYRELCGGVYRVVLPDGENLWYDANNPKVIYRDDDYAPISQLLASGYTIVGKVNNFKPKLK